MATITSAIVSAAGAGASVAQAINQNKLQKQASEAAKQAAQNLKSIREQNPMAGVQVPTMGNKLAMENINQNAADSLAALQGIGAEGVIAGVTNLNKSVRDAQLDVAADQQDMQYQRDTDEAQIQSGINARKAQRDYLVGMSELEGAQMAASDAQYNKNAAITGALSGLSTGINDLADVDKFDYMNPLLKGKLKRKLKFKPTPDAELENESTPQP
jgi:hypothetical protein